MAMCSPSGRPSPGADPLAPDQAEFEREQGCTEAEWLRWLPEAVHGHALTLAAGAAIVTLAEGHLQLSWQVLTPRRIALITLPRLQVRYAFSGVDAATRQRFMKRFDLHIQRGGG